MRASAAAGGAALAAVALAVAQSGESSVLRDRREVTKTHPLGQAVTVSLYGTDSRLRVTLVRFLDPARSRYYRARKGTRFVAFQIRYTKVGRSNYAGVPAAEATLVDTLGRAYGSASLDFGRRFQPWPLLVPDLNHVLSLLPHKTWTGYLGWVVPTAMQLREFRYSPGYGWTTAAWRLS
jgi:hypothetical protein